MSRDTIHVRECDRCKVKVEARGVEDFEGWGFASATGEKGGEKIGFANADICPECLELLIAWFTAIMREQDAGRTYIPRPAGAVIPPIREIAAKLISDSLAQSPQMAEYFSDLDGIDSLEDLQLFQAANALALMGWMADPDLSPQILERHQAAYDRLGPRPSDEAMA